MFWVANLLRLRRVFRPDGKNTWFQGPGMSCLVVSSIQRLRGVSFRALETHPFRASTPSRFLRIARRPAVARGLRFSCADRLLLFLHHRLATWCPEGEVLGLVLYRANEVCQGNPRRGGESG